MQRGGKIKKQTRNNLACQHWSISTTTYNRLLLVCGWGEW